MQRVTRIALGLYVTGCLVIAAACGGSSDSTTPNGNTDDGTVSGTYVLKTLNGSSLPGIYHLTTNERLMLDTATLRLSSNGAYSDIRTTTLFDATGEHAATSTHTGTWTSSGSTVTLSFVNDLGIPATEIATLSSGNLTKTESGLTLVFKKQ